ncbi:probable glucan endo-1,3-beta-glucosidase BG4 [Pistacia vera]|uniref:probable glucan endo-1,3-beta-glucosidase BG4 n=1 Tax=Pistacia vera TaxID=55513 RepID=UPI0012634A84|nr:probable glucan endo-1,3-beta-glucosidase BG4 [Pistacia vera]
MTTYILQALILSAITVSIAAAVQPFNIGVNYGMLGDDILDAIEVVKILKMYSIDNLRILAPDHATLEALRKSNIKLCLGIRNEDLPYLATRQKDMNEWFAENVQPYVEDVIFSYITVGHETIPSDYAPFILPVMQDLQTLLHSHGLDSIKVSTVISTATLGTSSPPSHGIFSTETRVTMIDVLKFLKNTNSPLLINVYPYFVVAEDPVNVRLDYALFTAKDVVVKDGNLSYYNMFEAIVDSFFWAMEKEGFSDVEVVISESGWPSAGNGNLTTPEMAYTYNYHFVRRVQNFGTPKRPQASLEGFIYELFNENRKGTTVEQNFGIMYPNKQPVYPLSINQLFPSLNK